jgi:hypothetical protein
LELACLPVGREFGDRNLNNYLTIYYHENLADLRQS